MDVESDEKMLRWKHKELKYLCNDINNVRISIKR